MTFPSVWFLDCNILTIDTFMWTLRLKKLLGLSQLNPHTIHEVLSTLPHLSSLLMSLEASLMWSEQRISSICYNDTCRPMYCPKLITMVLTVSNSLVSNSRIGSFDTTLPSRCKPFTYTIALLLTQICTIYKWLYDKSNTPLSLLEKEYHFLPFFRSCINFTCCVLSTGQPYVVSTVITISISNLCH